MDSEDRFWKTTIAVALGSYVGILAAAVTIVLLVGWRISEGVKSALHAIDRNSAPSWSAPTPPAESRAKPFPYGSGPARSDAPAHHRIGIDDKVLGGSPYILGTRVKVKQIVDNWQMNRSLERLREAFPEVDPEGLSQAISFAIYYPDLL